MKVRKKPVIVDATQFNYVDGIDGIETVKFATALGLSRNGPVSKLWELKTLEGWRIVKGGDWIITGIRGEKYTCPPYIFSMTYEPWSDSEVQLSPEALSLLELCRNIIGLAEHGDYSNGNDTYGIDEGRVRAGELLDTYRTELAKYDPVKELP